MAPTPNSSGTTARHPFLSQLLDLGIEESMAIAACEATAFSSVDAAMAFLFDNEHGNNHTQARESSGDGGSSSSNDDDLQRRRYKLTVVVRQDLGMSPGKIAAQTCHAALAAYRTVTGRAQEIARAWEAQGEPIIILQVADRAALDRVAAAAVAAGLAASTVRDAGRTEVAAGSVTCCAVGPGPADVVDLATGALRLLK